MASYRRTEDASILKYQREISGKLSPSNKICRSKTPIPVDHADKTKPNTQNAMAYFLAYIGK